MVYDLVGPTDSGSFHLISVPTQISGNDDFRVGITDFHGAHVTFRQPTIWGPTILRAHVISVGPIGFSGAH